MNERECPACGYPKGGRAWCIEHFMQRDASSSPAAEGALKACPECPHPTSWHRDGDGRRCDGDFLHCRCTRTRSSLESSAPPASERTAAPGVSREFVEKAKALRARIEHSGDIRGCADCIAAREFDTALAALDGGDHLASVSKLVPREAAGGDVPEWVPSGPELSDALYGMRESATDWTAVRRLIATRAPKPSTPRCAACNVKAGTLVPALCDVSGVWRCIKCDAILSPQPASQIGNIGMSPSTPPSGPSVATLEECAQEFNAAWSKSSGVEFVGPPFPHELAGISAVRSLILRATPTKAGTPLDIEYQQHAEALADAVSDHMDELTEAKHGEFVGDALSTAFEDFKDITKRVRSSPPRSSGEVDAIRAAYEEGWRYGYGRGCTGTPREPTDWASSRAAQGLRARAEGAS